MADQTIEVSVVSPVITVEASTPPGEPAGSVAAHAALSETHEVTGAIVGTQDVQEVSSKTLAAGTVYKEGETFTPSGAAHSFDMDGNSKQRVEIDQITELNVANCGAGKVVIVLIKNPLLNAITWGATIDWGANDPPDDGDGTKVALDGYDGTTAQASIVGEGFTI